jgi:hypothetical protein
MEEEVWHIRLIGSSYKPGWTYTVLDTSDWTLPLEQNPVLVNNPTVWELVYAIIPTLHQIGIYQDGSEE